MKKIFTFVAAALMAVSSFAAKETVMEVNYAEIATTNWNVTASETRGSQQIARNTSVDKRVENEKVYPFQVVKSEAVILDYNEVYVASGNYYLTLSSVDAIGLRCTNSAATRIAIFDLKEGDVLEIATNGGSASKATPTESAPATPYNLSDFEKQADTYGHTYVHTASRTANYYVYNATVSADGAVSFMVSNNCYIAYIKVTRGSDEYEIVKEEYDFQALGQAQESEGTVDVTFGTEVLTSPASIKLISFGEETFENRFAGNRDWAIRKHSNAAYCGLYNKNGYNNRYLAIMGLEEGNEVTIDFLCDSEQSLIFENAIVEDATAGDALVSGTTYTISEDGNLLLNEGANTKDKRVYIYKVTISKKVAKEGGDDTPTAIEDVKSAVKAVKMVENGQVVILRDGVRYNVLGARL